MKSRLIRTLSITGLIATASMVAANGQLLGGTPVAASTASSSTPSGPAAGTPSITASSSPVPGSTTQVAYVAGDAATLILDSADGTLRLVDFAPHPGWVTVRITQSTTTELEAHLESVSGQVRFAATLANGAVTTELETTGASGATVPSNSAPGNSAPGNSSPGNSAPDNSSPGNSAPSNSSPDNSTPDNSAPGNSTPSNSAPDNSSPGNTTPGDDDHGGSGGGSDDPPGDDHGGSRGGSDDPPGDDHGSDD
jgi:hypothetical protein